MRRGGRVPGFTLLNARGDGVVRFDPAAETRPVHLVFAEPASPEFAAVSASYSQHFAARAAGRCILVALSGPERVARRLTSVPAAFEVATHGGEVLRQYGFVAGAGLVVVEGPVLRERWRLPYRGDELPVD